MVLIGALFVAALYVIGGLTGDSYVILLAVLLTLILGASALWVRYGLRSLSYSRRLGNHKLAFGEETTLTVDVFNGKLLPLPWVLSRDQYTRGIVVSGTGPAGTEEESLTCTLFNFFAMRSYERVKRIYRVKGERRGVYEFGPVRLYVGDVFGFRRRQRGYESYEEVVVYPKVVPVETLGLPAARPMGDYLAQRRLMEDPLRYMGIREYVPGDSIRHLHWKATARTGELQTRTFEPSASHSFMIFLDVQTDADPYIQVREYLELLVSAAASVAADVIEQGYAVGLVANTGAGRSLEPLYVPPGQKPEQKEEILEALARIDGFRILSLAQLIGGIEPELGYATVVVLTSRPEESVQEALELLHDSGHPVELITVGDGEPAISPRLTHYHLGGREKWYELEEIELA